MGDMLRLREIPIPKLGLVLISYVAIVGTHSLKTIYYYTYQNSGWWLYLLAASLFFWGSAYYSSFHKRIHWVALICLAFFIGYMPFEIHLLGTIDLLTNAEANLSGLSDNLPKPIGIAVDVLFWPILTLIPLLSIGYAGNNRVANG